MQLWSKNCKSCMFDWVNQSCTSNYTTSIILSYSTHSQLVYLTTAYILFYCPRWDEGVVIPGNVCVCVYRCLTLDRGSNKCLCGHRCPTCSSWAWQQRTWPSEWSSCPSAPPTPWWVTPVCMSKSMSESEVEVTSPSPNQKIEARVTKNLKSVWSQYPWHMSN